MASTDNRIASLVASQNPTPISQLQPELPDQLTRVVRGEVTITWPYNRFKNTFAFLLAEPDVLLRRAKGQVRIELHGAAAKAVVDTGIGGGDEVAFALDGVQWARDESPGRIPGARVDWQLQFTDKLALQVKSAESGDLNYVNIDHPIVEPPPPIVVDQPTYVAEPEIPAAPAPPVSRVVTDVAMNEYPSPAFIKRARISYGALFEGGFDIFEEDGGVKGKGRKRSRFGRDSSAWRYTSQSPSPEPPSPSPDAMEEDSAHETRPSGSPRPPMLDEGSQTVSEEAITTNVNTIPEAPMTASQSPEQMTSLPSENTGPVVNPFAKPIISTGQEAPIPPVNPSSPPISSAANPLATPITPASQGAHIPPVNPFAAPISSVESILATPIIPAEEEAQVPLINPFSAPVSSDGPPEPSADQAPNPQSSSRPEKEPSPAPHPQGDIQAPPDTLFTASKPADSGFSMFGTSAPVRVDSGDDLAEQVRFGFSHIPQAAENTSVGQSVGQIPDNHPVSQYPEVFLDGHVPSRFADTSYVGDAEAGTEMDLVQSDGLIVEPPVVESFGDQWEVLTQPPHHNQVEGGHFGADALNEGTMLMEVAEALHADAMSPEKIPLGFSSYGSHAIPAPVEPERVEAESGASSRGATEEASLIDDTEILDHTASEVGVDDEDETEYDENGEPLEAGDYDQRNYNIPDDDDEGSSSVEEEIDELEKRYGNGRSYDISEDDEDEYDEDDGYGEEWEEGDDEEYDEDEEAHNIQWGSANRRPQPPPPTSGPVVISLLSDSEDDDDGPAPTVSPPVQQTRQDQASPHPPTTFNPSVQEEPPQTAVHTTPAVDPSRSPREMVRNEAPDTESSLEISEVSSSPYKSPPGPEAVNESREAKERIRAEESEVEDDQDSVSSSSLVISSVLSSPEVGSDQRIEVADDQNSVSSSSLVISSVLSSSEAESDQHIEMEDDIPVDDHPVGEHADLQMEEHDDRHDDRQHIPIYEEADGSDNSVGDAQIEPISKDDIEVEEVGAEAAKSEDVDAHNTHELNDEVMEVDDQPQATGNLGEAVGIVDVSSSESGPTIQAPGDVVVEEDVEMRDATSPVPKKDVEDRGAPETPEPELSTEPAPMPVEEPTNGTSMTRPETPSQTDAIDHGTSHSSDITMSASPSKRQSKPADNGSPQPRRSKTPGRKAKGSSVLPSSPPVSQSFESQVVYPGVQYSSSPATSRPASKEGPSARQLPTPMASFVPNDMVPLAAVVEEYTIVETTTNAAGTQAYVTRSVSKMESSLGSIAHPEPPTESAIPESQEEGVNEEVHRDEIATLASASVSMTMSTVHESMELSPPHETRAARRRRIEAERAAGERTTPKPETEEPAKTMYSQDPFGESPPDISIALARQAGRKLKRAPEPPQTSSPIAPIATRTRSSSFRMSATPELEDVSINLAKGALASPSRTRTAVDGTTTASLKMELTKSLRALRECISLKSLRNHLDEHPNIVGIVTSQPQPPVRAKGGPREYVMTFNLTDGSTAPTQVVEVQLYRPHKESLPVVKPGDAILLYKFQVKALSNKGFGLRSHQESSWAVFDADDGPPQIKGPPVEDWDDYSGYARLLRTWYGSMDEVALGKLERANKKFEDMRQGK
ncbi:hypothetical protein QBC47DRAFT_368366 [Echria macrotheca]|uniref:Telomeric single stranded DNA binding POT1/Cdc13 domain-containing protein n=1 Tax=Echria macrotheca TaxID=438768 RepID=A0AAJ0FF00_9PEZI|nr:hypothetical protein QBC47DRAFT_368366 [Echria macrotheca]